MSGRTLALILASLCYWGLAVMILGGLAMGDCFGNEACGAAADRALKIGWTLAAGLYVAGVGLFLFCGSGRR